MASASRDRMVALMHRNSNLDQRLQDDCESAGKVLRKMERAKVFMLETSPKQQRNSECTDPDDELTSSSANQKNVNEPWKHL